MTQYTSQVEIDGKVCREDEVRVLGMALTLLRQIALGDFAHLRCFVEVALQIELLGEESVLNSLKDLILQLDGVLWNDRDRMTVFDQRVSVYATLAHGLERQLARDLHETDRVRNHLKERKYNP